MWLENDSKIINCCWLGWNLPTSGQPRLHPSVGSEALPPAQPHPGKVFPDLILTSKELEEGLLIPELVLPHTRMFLALSGYRRPDRWISRWFQKLHPALLIPCLLSGDAASSTNTRGTCNDIPVPTLPCTGDDQGPIFVVFNPIFKYWGHLLGIAAGCRSWQCSASPQRDHTKPLWGTSTLATCLRSSSHSVVLPPVAGCKLSQLEILDSLSITEEQHILSIITWCCQLMLWIDFFRLSTPWATPFPRIGGWEFSGRAAAGGSGCQQHPIPVFL